MSDPVSERRFKDASLTKTIALPSGAATAATASIDLGKTKPFPITEKFHCKLTTTAATGVNDKTIVLSLQDSANNSSFAAIAGTGTLTIVAASSAYAAGSLTVSLSPGTRRYIRAVAVGESGGGNASDGDLTLDLLF